jgi:peptidyl-prolyl cis-trans isomerase C
MSMKRIPCILASLAGAATLGVLAGSAAAQTPPATAPVTPVAATTAPAPSKAATVNGEPISMTDLDAILKRVPLPVELPPEKKRQLQLDALGMLIDDKLLEQFMRQNGPRVDVNEVNAKMIELAEGLKKQNKALADFYRDTNQNEAQLRQSIGQTLQWAAYARAHVSDQQLQKYYTDNKEFFDGVVVRASHIVLRLAPTAAPAEKQSAMNKLTDIRAQIVAGKLDFAAAAKQHSQCPTAAQGGDVGTFPRKFVMDENFARVAFSLQPGQISDVIQTDWGLHVLKVTERKPGKGSEFAKCKDEVREFYMEEFRINLLAQQRKTAKIEVRLP